MLNQAVKKWVVIAALVCLGTLACGEDNGTGPGPLPDSRDICITMANGARLNDSGVPDRACDPIAFQQYYVNFSGPGLKEVHISDNSSDPEGEVTEGETTSGVLFFTNTGSRGYTEEAILLVSVNVADPSMLAGDFSLSIRSVGYQIVADANQQVVEKTFVAGALDRTFTAGDFIYGPQAWKPAGSQGYPLWYGQDVSDPSSQSILMFVDLNVGILNGQVYPGSTHEGAAAVEYLFTGLGGQASFNAYGYAVHANAGQGINWTNKTEGEDASGWTVIP